jgi:hypothetical protein
MRLQTLQHLAGEELLDEAMQGEIGNLLIREMCQ